MPGRPWVMTQTWHNLLFAHWPVAAGTLARAVPAQFEIDQFDGSAWIGIVPFSMTNVAPRGVPALPWISHFPELNVRTYVRVDGKPGIYFFSLDAGNVLAVHTARMLFRLPYYSAAMAVRLSADEVDYTSRRSASGPSAEFAARYAPTGVQFIAARGTLEYFLTERYCLYGRDHFSRPYRLDIHHPPWILQPAGADISRNSMADGSGIRLPGIPPLLHFAKRQDMVAWWPARL